MGILLVKASGALVDAIRKSLAAVKEELLTVENYPSAIDEIHKRSPEAIICINDPDDIELIKFLKTIKTIKTSFFSTILISSKEDLLYLIPGNIEFDDIIVKPFTREELVIRIAKLKKLSILKIQAYKSRKNMLKLSKEDPHTGFLNRRAILDEALKEMNRSSREVKYMSGIMLNISNFKNFTDKYDSVSLETFFLEFSRRIFKSCRPYDKIGRYGISQFLIILPDATAEQALKVANRIIASTAIKNIHVINDKINVELEIGISELSPNDTSKNKNVDDILMNDLILDSFLRRTEIAMNQAQKTGINSIEVYKV